MVHHYSRLALGILLGLLLLVVLPTGVLADHPIVEITVYGWIVGLPNNFTITYVNDYQVDLTWFNPPDNVNTMVRAAYGHVPVDRFDGYQVYLGPDMSCSDTAVTLASPEVVYYRAWSETSEGWSDLFASGNTEGFMSASFLFIGFIALAGLLTYFAYRIRMLLFTVAAALAWVGLGIWLLLSDSTNLQLTDTWTQVLGLVFVVMALAVLTLQMRTDITHEKSIRGVSGYPGAETARWKEWGPNPGKGPKLTADQQSAQRQAEHREKIRAVRRRYR